MAIRSETRVRTDLQRLGFRIPKNDEDRLSEALAEFQRSYSIGPALKITGENDRLTDSALTRAVKDGKVSPNFKYNEFVCKCGGKYKACRGIKINPKLLTALEELRSDYFKAKGLSLVSAYRCKEHNRAIGGATNSQHLKGNAADIPPLPKNPDLPPEVKGIGIKRKTGRIIHIDVRRSPRVVRWYYS